jgi:shikimate dehydrogenase
MRLGLLGKKLEHSFSPAYFAEKFKSEGLDAIYQALPLEDIGDFKNWLNYHQLDGFNITIPYKESILPHLDGLDRTAAEIGSVNVVKSYNGKLWGFNTDYLGFANSISPYLKAGDKALVFGTGGSSRAIGYALSKMGIEYKKVSRKDTGYMVYDEVNQHLDAHRILINTTPLGMYPQIATCVPIDYTGVTSKHHCFDLVYNPEETEFLRRCKQQGATAQNGLEMLQLQAELSWDIWSY